MIFEGILTSEGVKGTPPRFDLAVIDVRFREHPVTQMEIGGLVPTQGKVTTRLMVTPKAIFGDANQELGELRLSWTTESIIKITYIESQQEQTITNGGTIKVKSGGFDKELIIHTKGERVRDTITATFTWDRKFWPSASSSGGSSSPPPTAIAQDCVRITTDQIAQVILDIYPEVRPSYPDDDLIELESKVPPWLYWAPALAKLNRPPSDDTKKVVLKNPDKRLRFGRGTSQKEPEPQESITLEFTEQNYQTGIRFYIAGVEKSTSMWDAIIEPWYENLNAPSRAHPVTVFWYKDAELQIKPIGNDKQIGVTFTGKVTVQPNGIKEHYLQTKPHVLKTLRLGLIQNGQFSRSIQVPFKRAQYTATVPDEVKSKISRSAMNATFKHSTRWLLDTLHKEGPPVADASSDAFRSPFDEAPISTRDIPLITPVPLFQDWPIFWSGRQVGIAYYEGVDNATLHDNFRDWLVIYHLWVPQETKTWWIQRGNPAVTHPYTVLKYGTWQLDQIKKTKKDIRGNRISYIESSRVTVHGGVDPVPGKTPLPITIPPRANPLLADPKEYNWGWVAKAQ